jgi:uncharacterized protein (DUF2062 family)
MLRFVLYCSFVGPVLVSLVFASGAGLLLYKFFDQPWKDADEPALEPWFVRTVVASLALLLTAGLASSSYLLLWIRRRRRELPRRPA